MFQGALQDPAGKRQCHGDQACSKNISTHLFLRQMWSPTLSEGNPFLWDCSIIPRTHLPQQVLLIGNSSWGADSLVFPPTLCPSSLATAKTSSAPVYPTQSTRSHPGKTTWKAALQQHLLAGALSVLRPHCSGPLCVESEHRELLFVFYGHPGSFL